MSFYITLKCDKNIHELDKDYRLRGDWEVGIIKVINHSIEAPVIWIISDLVEYTNYNSIPLQILDVISTKVNQGVVNNKASYTRVAKKRFNSINIQLKHDPENDYDHYFYDLYLRLHFRKR
jgi:hypothetical protein